MKKKIEDILYKNALIISDDFIGRYEFDKKLNKMSKECNCKIDIRTTFKNTKIQKYDVIFIDYGLITEEDEEMYAIPLLKKANHLGIKFVWLGVYGARCNKDCRHIFPELKFLHNITGLSIDCIEYSIPAILDY